MSCPIKSYNGILQNKKNFTCKTHFFTILYGQNHHLIHLVMCSVPKCRITRGESSIPPVQWMRELPSTAYKQVWTITYDLKIMFFLDFIAFKHCIKNHKHCRQKISIGLIKFLLFTNSNNILINVWIQPLICFSFEYIILTSGGG